MSTPIDNRIRFALLALASTLGICGTAAADDRGPWAFEKTVSTTVDLHDINIATPDGARAAYSKIVAAATDICVTPIEWPAMKNGTQLRYEARCLELAVDDAVARASTAAGVDLLAVAGITGKAERVARVH